MAYLPLVIPLINHSYLCYVFRYGEWVLSSTYSRLSISFNLNSAANYLLMLVISISLPLSFVFGSHSLILPVNQISRKTKPFRHQGSLTWGPGGGGMANCVHVHPLRIWDLENPKVIQSYLHPKTVTQDVFCLKRQQLWSNRAFIFTTNFQREGEGMASEPH